MLCIYRLEYVNPFGRKADHQWLESYYPSGWKGGGVSFKWSDAMEELFQSPAWPHCKVFRAPPFPPELAQQIHIYKLRKGKTLPDILCVADRLIVSQAAREVIESIDDFEHEFTETEIQDKQRQRINQKPYFLLSIRRYLEIAAIGGEATGTINYSIDRDSEKDILRTLANCPELMAKVAEVPFWRRSHGHANVFLSEEALGKLRAAGLTGLKDFSNKLGEPGEAVGRFCCE